MDVDFKWFDYKDMKDCRGYTDSDIKPVKKEDNKGSVFTWLLAQISCTHFTGRSEYDWKSGKWNCKGDWVPPMLWRR
jgi:hypothetical protein